MREKSFSYLSQRLGINTQSSTYLILSDEHESYFSDKNISKYELAIEYFDEHEYQTDDCLSCPFDSFRTLFEMPGSKILALKNSNLKDAIDRVKVDMLAFICGANEPSDRLFTKDHRIVTIDNEQMFSTKPSELEDCDWFNDDYHEAMKLAIELCQGVASISDSEISLYTSIPNNYHVNELWSIKEIMVSARSYAERFLTVYA